LKLYEMSDEDKIAHATRFKEQGNLFFKIESYEEALRKYEIARIYIRQMESAILPRELLENVTIPLLNNIALCNIRLRNNSDALLACNEAIALLPNFKSFYIRASCWRKRGEPERAVEDLMRSAKLSPNNKSIRDELENAKREVQLAKQREISMFSGK